MSYQPWDKPDPQSLAGLNAVSVYGENIQFTTGLNHQVALGSNLQLCVNPGVLFDLLEVPGSSTLSALWGSGLGGNMQFTIGSSANFVWGRQFQFNMGPEQINVDASAKPAPKILCALIGCACLAYAIAYGLIPDEDDRATAVIVFQTTIDLLLAALMTETMSYKTIDEKTTDGTRGMFNASSVEHSEVLAGFANALSFVTAMAAAIIPPVISANEEGHFDGDTQDSSS